jgi:hypothetical protein
MTSTAYFLEVDLEIPECLHSILNDYPPAPLCRSVIVDELSNSYQIPLIQKLDIKGGIYKLEKLVADIHPKKK